MCLPSTGLSEKQISRRVLPRQRQQRPRDARHASSPSYGVCMIHSLYLLFDFFVLLCGQACWTPASSPPSPRRALVGPALVQLGSSGRHSSTSTSVAASESPSRCLALSCATLYSQADSLPGCPAAPSGHVAHSSATVLPPPLLPPAKQGGRTCSCPTQLHSWTCGPNTACLWHVGGCGWKHGVVSALTAGRRLVVGGRCRWCSWACSANRRHRCDPCGRTGHPTCCRCREAGRR